MSCEYKRDFRVEMREVKSDDDTEVKGIVEGYAAVFDVEDSTGDIIERGAFKRTLKQKLPDNLIKVLWNHKPDEPIGKVLELREDKDGLRFRIELVTEDNPPAKKVLSLIRHGVIDRMSFGFDSVKADWIEKGDHQMGRRLKEVELFELSPVTFPAAVGAAITGLKTVVPYQNLPLADRAKAWEQSAAEKRVRTWADASDEPNTKYRRAFLWFDSDNSELFGSYKLQIGDVVDGDLVAVPRGVFAVAAVLQGARGGVEIPEADKARVRSVIERYYGKMASEWDDDSIVPPWKKSDDDYSETADDVVVLLKGRQVAALRKARDILADLVGEVKPAETPEDREELLLAGLANVLDDIAG